MQTWARRGMQAALVTGGMLAAGTGVASASGTCPERPSSPLDDGTPRRNGVCFAGELFPPEGGNGSKTARHATMAGTIDPVRDLLPAVEDAMTQQMPRITDGPWYHEAAAPGDRVVGSPPEALRRTPTAAEVAKFELAGWVADAAPLGGDRTIASSPVGEHPTAELGLRSGGHARGKHAAFQAIGTPSDGFNRSLNWSGSIGDVTGALSGHAGQAPGTAPTAVAESQTLPPPLVVPGHDPAFVEVPQAVAAVPDAATADNAGGIIALWQGMLGDGETADPAAPGAVLSSQSVDLTSAALDLGPDLRTVPGGVLDAALSEGVVPREAGQQEFVPLQVPGEFQERATELPDLSGDVRLVSVEQENHGARNRPVPDGGVEATLFGLGELNALGGDTELSTLSPLEEALQGNRLPLVPQQRSGEPVPPPEFTRTPHLSRVVVKVVDELLAAVPERNRVTTNPFGESAARTALPSGGMALPVLDDLPRVTALQDVTVPMPALSADGTPHLDLSGRS